MLQFLHELFPGLRWVRWYVINAFLGLMDTLAVQNFNGSDKIGLLLELLVLNQAIRFDFGAIDDKLHG
jgi:hypothetical protein